MRKLVGSVLARRLQVTAFGARLVRPSLYGEAQPGGRPRSLRSLDAAR